MTQPTRAVARMETVAGALDGAVDLPVVGRVGLDPLLGLVPVAGDLLAALAALYIVVEAARAGVSTRTLVRMLVNVGLDAALGTVPVVGDVFDLVWRASDRNVRLAKRDLGLDGET
ncbi:DUF4112 domain-containing protein [Halosegnis sp.]|uniref:DUF4112 domain-containing protein n=1 Tax=Halosegnis sp. TaxID=2864959 RepID=UPI0035D46A13